mmetsp:Transcript_3839/g.11742  ORF Transcript_3839/g.11742 Transcript_3839/m.11742 type:complete len:306 (-) Transcript_3839:1694-2611(-)
MQTSVGIRHRGELQSQSRRDHVDVGRRAGVQRGCDALECVSSGRRLREPLRIFGGVGLGNGPVQPKEQKLLVQGRDLCEHEQLVALRGCEVEGDDAGPRRTLSLFRPRGVNSLIKGEPRARRDAQDAAVAGEPQRRNGILGAEGDGCARGKMFGRDVKKVHAALHPHRQLRRVGREPRRRRGEVQALLVHQSSGCGFEDAAQIQRRGRKVRSRRHRHRDNAGAAARGAHQRPGGGRGAQGEQAWVFTLGVDGGRPRGRHFEELPICRPNKHPRQVVPEAAGDDGTAAVGDGDSIDLNLKMQTSRA